MQAARLFFITPSSPEWCINLMLELSNSLSHRKFGGAGGEGDFDAAFEHPRARSFGSIPWVLAHIFRKRIG